MDTMSEKVYRTKVPIYGSSLTLIVTSDVPAFYKQHISNDDREWECIAFTALIKGKLTMVVPVNASIGTLAHEAFHAAADTLNHHSSRWGSGNQEPIAYLIGWIMDWIYRVVDGGPKNIPKN